MGFTTITLEGIDHDVWLEQIEEEGEELVQITIWRNDRAEGEPGNWEMFRFDADELARYILHEEANDG